MQSSGSPAAMWSPASRFEHAPVTVHADSSQASRAVAAEVAQLIRTRQQEGRAAVLGMATGSTPIKFYAELVRLHREERLSFANVTTFNLDEYYGLPPAHPQSYHHFMRTNLFDHVDLPTGQVHLPDGLAARADIDACCGRYEEQIREAGGIDFQILGIGRTGHIGFNEPGSPRPSRTRLVTLDPLTRHDAAGEFGGEAQTPRHAITMGVRTILAARRVVLMAWGRHKAEIVRTAIEGDVSSHVTASFLQEHDQATFVLDAAAASALTRFRAPWLIGALEDQGLAWDDSMTRRAIIWLSRRCTKPILKLTDDDYNEAGLQDLLHVHGSAYEANLAGFYQLQHTITGWPGGRNPQRLRPGDGAVRPLRAPSAAVFPKRALVFSPHPDDDVASMGGTLCRLVDQGHEVHVAYQASGANAVSDEAVWRTLQLARDIRHGTAERAESAGWCRGFERTDAPPDRPELRRWKALIRQHEARAAARICGLPPERLHFLDLPLYGDGSGTRRVLGERDVSIMTELLGRLEPHLIFAAGDVEDPLGTHRLCLRALREALARSIDAQWAEAAELWLYRGAWATWDLDEIDMAVPLSPQEVLRRRQAMFRHESQREQVLFPGRDQREFWQRSEERGRELAETFNALGLAEYEAIEAFRRYAIREFAAEAQL